MPTMTRTERLLVLVAAIPLVVGFMWAGATICNFVLVEFFGPSAPQPSVLGWLGFWVVGFIIANMHLDINWQGIGGWFERSSR